jgi:hypothetical protein
MSGACAWHGANKAWSKVYLGIAVKVERVIMVLGGGFSSTQGSTGGGQACGYLYIMPIIRMPS